MTVQYIGNDFYEIKTRDNQVIVLTRDEFYECTSKINLLEQDYIISNTKGFDEVN